MNDVMKVLEQVAAKLGVAVEYLWEVLTRQQIAEGITNIILASMCLMLFIVICCGAPRVSKYYLNKYKDLKNDRIENGTGFNGSHVVPSFEEDSAHTNAKDIPWIAFWCALGILIPLAAFTIFGVQKLVNPEYFAIKEIMNAIGNSIV